MENIKIMSTGTMDSIQKTMEWNGNDPATPNFNETNQESLESIADFYDGAVVMVTGGTGFVGKALLEKLLRSCPGIDTIYVLMRPKRGLTVEQRYKELLKNQVFDRIRARWPERLSKLIPIAGDVSAPNLGVSGDDMQLMERVSMLLHSAATVRFTEPLHVAAALNVQGTAHMLALASTMPRLKALVHVSTAYSNAPKSHIEERVYPPPYDPDSILRCAKMLPPETMEVISASLQGDHPNPYTLTKALAEAIVYNHSADLPVCIVRPSIVTAAHQEPFPGWIDNIYGVTGLLMEMSRGTYRSGYCKQEMVIDIVPVDMVVNSCILAAWRQATKKPGRCPVYNVTSGSVNPLQWGNFSRLCMKWSRENPTKYVMWYPNFTFTESRFMNTFWEVSLHFLPAFLYDMLLRAQGRKAIMMKLARRFKMAAATGEYFANHEWQFGITELTALHNDASNTLDGSSFPHWPSIYDWNQYMGSYMMGIRKFILKDTAESLPAARTKLRRLYWVHKLLQAATGYYIFKFVAGRLR
ncbi:putative fatty acyl-CoA reductase CG5065 [Pectinophora gossypiella]|uniref:putative fatty acyl-CoA reductase CG5065 n=1 Tax=Pectinophora gossypiella TaxID=13191 RepID=UPI00214E64AC|nr:putative fatty acyl-CoA reductase CG5065 [Pectinophora gossypiella]